MNDFIKNRFQRLPVYVKAETKVQAFCLFFDIEDGSEVDEEILDGKTYLVFIRDKSFSAVVKELYYSWELDSKIYDVRPVFGNYNDE